MRSHVQNILLLLTSMLLTVVATTSCNNSPKESGQGRTLIIKLSSSGSFRAVEEGTKENSYTVDTYTPITLFFYDTQGEPTEPCRIELKSNEGIQRARNTNGYKMEAREAVSRVSTVAGIPGIIKPSGLDDREIYNLQDLGGTEARKDGFLYKVSCVAPKTPIQQDLANQNELTVTLQPVPNVARLEISDDAEVPFESAQPAVDYIIEKFMKRYSDDQANYSWLPTP